MERRAFIKGAIGVAILGKASVARAMAEKEPSRAEAMKQALLRIEQEERYKQARAKGLPQAEIEAYWRVLPEEIENLDYAFTAIQPKTHLDYCFAFSCKGPNPESRRFVDELVRRRRGMPSVLPDHPGLEPDWLIYQDTSRVLVFQEQIDNLLLSLNVADQRSVCRIMRLRIWFGEMEPDDFTDRAIKGQYPCRWGKSDLEAIHKALAFYIPHALPYNYCSSVVSKAEAMIPHPPSPSAPPRGHKDRGHDVVRQGAADQARLRRAEKNTR